jgi:cytosine permease
MLPDYLSKATPNPASNRAPWYANTAPTYAGIFLWVAFYKQIAEGSLTQASLKICLAALVLAGVFCYGLFYRVPATLGMKTGYPLYVVGSSTFGTKGGYLMPGLLMGLLQIGWFAVATFVASDFILKGFGVASEPMTASFIITGTLWGLIMAAIAAKGIQYVAKVGQILNWIPLLMLLVVLFKTAGGVGHHHLPNGATPNNFGAVTTILAAVIGFFATAGAAGTDIVSNARNDSDVKWGGLVGVGLAILIAGGLPLISIAGAHGLGLVGADKWDYADVVQAIGGPMGSAMFFLFAIASIPATCFCSFIAGNSFSTMIPGVPRISSSMVGAVVGIILAVTGVAANLIGFFNIVGASFGPIIGAMIADYLLSGRKWAGPREGINMAGYLAWAVGFIVGILPFLPIPADLKPYTQPAGLYSLIAGFIVYWIAAKAGMEPKVVAMPMARVAVKA